MQIKVGNTNIGLSYEGEEETEDILSRPEAELDFGAEKLRRSRSFSVSVSDEPWVG